MEEGVEGARAGLARPLEMLLVGRIADGLWVGLGAHTK